MSEYKTFTSESVSEGHPDKMSDQISDAILDAFLKDDPESRVACETLVKTDLVVIAGEITSNAEPNLEEVVRKVINDIGYDNDEVGCNGSKVEIVNAIGMQSNDIALGVDEGTGTDESQGAGDQGLMFGYANNETSVLMPAPITYSHLLVKKQAEVRKSGLLPWLRPDAKSQLSFVYDELGKPNYISAIENRQGLKIACLEEIAFKQGWIKKSDIIRAIKFYGNCEYSNYLKQLISI